RLIRSTRVEGARRPMKERRAPSCSGAATSAARRTMPRGPRTCVARVTPYCFPTMSSPSVLSQPALVLNESWMAIHTVSVRRALRLVCTGAAKAVLPESFETHSFDTWAELAVHPDEPCIRTVKLRVKVPEVILLTRYDGLPNPAAVFS